MSGRTRPGVRRRVAAGGAGRRVLRVGARLRHRAVSSPIGDWRTIPRDDPWPGRCGRAVATSWQRTMVTEKTLPGMVGQCRVRRPVREVDRFAMPTLPAERPGLIAFGLGRRLDPLWLRRSFVVVLPRESLRRSPTVAIVDRRTTPALQHHRRSAPG